MEIDEINQSLLPMERVVMNKYFLLNFKIAFIRNTFHL